ncbi:MAG: divalent-cation tolerance protein CutA [Bryobacteraceae bacterium]
MTDKIVVFSACSSQHEAEKIAGMLVEKRLAACVNLISGVQSIYRWRGAVERSKEIMLLIKSTRELLPQLQSEISKMHSYEVPEALAVPVVDGMESYLEWMDRELQPAGARE